MTRFWKGKRILSLLLALVLIATNVPLTMPITAASSCPVCGSTDCAEDHGAATSEENTLIGKQVKFISSYPWLWTDPNNTNSQVQADASKLPKVMVIVGVHQFSATTTLYQLDAAEGYTWPAGYPAENFTGKYWVESTKVTILEPCDKCGEVDCGSDHKNWCEICKVDDCDNDHITATVTDGEGKQQVVTVAGKLPEGAELKVTIPEINGEKLPNVFDIKIYDKDGNEWQPIDEGRTVTVSIPVDTDAEFVDVIHFIDYKNAITKDTQVTSVQDIPIETVPFLDPAIEAYGDGSHIAVERFNDAQVKSGRANIECSSFSIYVLTDDGFIPAENQDGNVPIDNSEAGNNGRLTYYASPGTTFNLTTENMSVTFWDPFSLEGSYSSGVKLENVNYGLWRGATVTVDEVNAGDVITVKFRGWSYTYYVDIHIVREVTVSYDNNGKTNATGMPNPLTKKIATDGTITYEIPEGQPTAENCTFKGWALNNAGTGILYQPGAEFTLVGDLTFYAIWEENEFDVSFNHNYKVGNNDPQVDVMENVQHHTTIEFPEPPYRENYTFLGWCASQDGTGDRYYAGDKITITSAATYYAIWGADLTITISGNISEIKMMEGTEQTWKDVPAGYFTQAGQSANREDVEGFLKGTTFRIKAAGASNFSLGAGKAYTSTGATVTFWTEDGGKTLFVRLPNGVTEDTSITITTEEYKFTVSYVPNGGTAVEPDLDISSGISIDPYNKTTTREGYTFDGWYSDAALTQKVSGPVKITAHTTFYAKWSADDFTIIYDLNGGVLTGGVTNPEKYNAETEDFTLNNPTREGYIFDGWTGTGLTEATKEVTVALGSMGNRRYIANWTPITYTITYNLTDSNGVTGTNHESNPSTYTAESWEIVLKDPTPPAGYRFVKWVEGNTIAEGSTGDKTFTAIWEPALTSLTISVGCDDPDQVFIFRIQSVEDGVDMKVTVTKDKSVTICGVTIGKSYTVSMESWPWRYTTTEAVVTKSINAEAAQNTFAFDVTCDNDFWLDGNDYFFGN